MKSRFGRQLVVIYPPQYVSSLMRERGLPESRPQFVGGLRVVIRQGVQGIKVKGTKPKSVVNVVQKKYRLKLKPTLSFPF